MKNLRTIRDIQKEFDEKWKKVECSAHERTSSSACICDSLDDINTDYGYDEIKQFISSSFKELLEQVVPDKKDDNISDLSLYQRAVYWNDCRQEVEEKIKEILE